MKTTPAFERAPPLVLGGHLLPPVESRRFAALCRRWYEFPANDRVAGVHDRMRVIIPPDAYDRWLGKHRA
jgi:hypothetical protein